MDRRVLLTGLFGVAGATALAAVLPPQAKALTGVPSEDPTAQSNVLPNLEELKAGPEESGEPAIAEEGVELAQYYRRRRRRYRRRRVRRWRRYCRRYWWGGGYRRRCRRRPIWIWIDF